MKFRIAVAKPSPRFWVSRTLPLRWAVPNPISNKSRNFGVLEVLGADWLLALGNVLIVFGAFCIAAYAVVLGGGMGRAPLKALAL
jgi:hypothetical protein